MEPEDDSFDVTAASPIRENRLADIQKAVQGVQLSVFFGHLEKAEYTWLKDNAPQIKMIITTEECKTLGISLQEAGQITLSKQKQRLSLPYRVMRGGVECVLDKRFDDDLLDSLLASTEDKN